MNHLIYAKNTVNATQNKSMKNRLIDVCLQNQPSIAMGVVKYDRFVNTARWLAMSFKSLHEMSVCT